MIYYMESQYFLISDIDREDLILLGRVPEFDGGGQGKNEFK